MSFLTDLLRSIWDRILDNKGKVTSTGGFLFGIIVTLALKDLYPDLEASYRRRIRQLRGVNIPHPLPGQTDYVRLEDHTRRNSKIVTDPQDVRRTHDRDAAEKIAVGIEGMIGNTPLIKLRALSEAVGCEILAKAEFLNGAGNSPKDRVALSMINHAEAEGLLVPGRGDVVYEGTVGSTGISLAAVCRARGYGCYICMPNDVATEKSTLLTNLGATVERVLPASIIDQDQFVNVARRRAEEHTSSSNQKGQGFFADQFENTANYLANQSTTGPEIYAQCGGRLDAFVSGAGTGGTISGVALALKPLLPNLKVVLADPQGSGLYNKVKYGVMFSSTETEGTRRRHQVDSVVEGVGINRLTANFEAGMGLVDDAVKVTDEQAMRMARWVVQREGVFIGASSAVNLVAAVRVGRDLGKGGRVVTIICDSGTRHLSRFWKGVGELAVSGEEGSAELNLILDMEK
ncbi:Cysteine synthase 2 [Friedmanniomyces endolithicus]|nr:Cysteine synthase 2 [Friedmanniomyces endolithicus]KAK0795955.1 Cysteine synthase 2 [Friedmanniomyces endolithicus]KAK0798803.1 Cysteine synthase 2 [Friedmanniomyces endolithicus]KAK0804189.1 Cysteine synthase 2 [Friedmanniomyces endolithicus]KAK0847283.1 Cysteine synthase 2 [Friedmanniomyces endolithicus]